jgi:hypothetical protein
MILFQGVQHTDVQKRELPGWSLESNFELRSFFKEKSSGIPTAFNNK